MAIPRRNRAHSVKGGKPRESRSRSDVVGDVAPRLALRGVPPIGESPRRNLGWVVAVAVAGSCLLGGLWCLRTGGEAKAATAPLSPVMLQSSGDALQSTTTTHDGMVEIPGYGLVVEVTETDALGAVVRKRIDSAGRMIQSVDAAGQITNYSYDANGNLLRVRDPNGVGFDYAYDPLNRRISTTDTAGNSTHMEYNLGGNLVAEIDAKGHRTTHQYDSRGRRISTTDRLGFTTHWTYDPVGNELSMTDAEGQTTSYVYDMAGRKVQTIWPDHVASASPGDPGYGMETISRDPLGRVKEQRDQRGTTITYVYDLAGRMVRREYRELGKTAADAPDDHDSFAYDAASRVLSANKGRYANSLQFAYDAAGRKASESLTIAGQTHSVGTAYDKAGRVTQLTYPDGAVVDRTYDSRSLLSTVAIAGTNIDSRTYDAGGRLTSETLGNGQAVTRTYVTGDNLPASIQNSAVGNYSYAWDANKNKTGETITGAMNGYTSSMAFDDQNRLTSWNRSNGDAQAWTLSPVNDWQSFTKNGTTETRTHGPAHEVLTVGPATIQYDSRGNMTSDEFATARTYDADGKVSQAVVPAGSARGIPGTHTYQYDALGRRVRKTIGGANPSDTVFAHTGEQIVADYSAGTAPASPTAKYVWGSYIDELVCQIDNTTKLYPHRNQQYSTIAVTDQTGTVIERYAYTSYGEIIALDPTTLVVRTSAPFTRYTYTGREYDAETGSYHFRSRIYLPSLGRFPSHDPILYPDGYNTYAGWFAVQSTDSRGMQIEDTDPFGPVQEREVPGPCILQFSKGPANQAVFLNTPSGKTCSSTSTVHKNVKWGNSKYSKFCKGTETPVVDIKVLMVADEIFMRMSVRCKTGTCVPGDETRRTTTNVKSVFYLPTDSLLCFIEIPYTADSTTVSWTGSCMKGGKGAVKEKGCEVHE